MPDDSSNHYHVSIPGPVREKIRSFLKDAARAGVLQQLQNCLRGIEERLITRPLEWGEPVNHFHELKMLLFHGALAPIHVEDAVNEEHVSSTFAGSI